MASTRFACEKPQGTTWDNRLLWDTAAENRFPEESEILDKLQELGAA